MEGSALAAQRQLERDVTLAHQIEWMARQKMLQPVSHYLKKLKSKGGATGAELVARFRAMKDAGAPVTITRIKRK